MRRRFILAAAAVLVGFSTCGAEERLNESEQATSKPKSLAARSLPAKLGWAKYDIVMGRLTLVQTRHNQCKSHAVRDQDAGLSQSYRVGSSEGKLSSTYTDESATSRLHLEFYPCGRVQIAFESDEASVLFEQSSRGNVSLEVSAAKDSGKESISLRAPTCWHLFLAHNECCRQHLFPLLRSLRPDWRLEEQCRKIEESLFITAEREEPLQHARMQFLVDQFRNLSYSHRQAAHDELRAMGQPVLTFLDTLDPSSLDGEQRHRIAVLREELTPTTGDTTRRVSLQLANDRAMWLALLQHPSAVERYLAVQRLEQLCNQTIAYDPQADADTRAAQAAKLTQRLLR